MALRSDPNRPINQSLLLWILLVGVKSISGSVAQFLCHQAFKNKTTAFSNLQFHFMPLLLWVAILTHNYLTPWAATPQCLHNDPPACTYDSISPCSLKVTFLIVRGSRRSGPGWGFLLAACPRCLLTLAKDGWEWSKYSSSFPPDQHRRFGPVTRQTGPGIRTQTLFHGGLALSPSLDYTGWDHGGPASESDLPTMWPILSLSDLIWGIFWVEIWIKKEKLIIGVNALPTSLPSAVIALDIKVWH